MRTALDILQEVSTDGVTVESAIVTPLRADKAKIIVYFSGPLDRSSKLALIRKLEGQAIPDVGKILSISSTQVAARNWIVAYADTGVRPMNREQVSTALSPFGGPMRLNGRQFTWLYRHGFPARLPDHRFTHASKGR